MRAEHVAQPSTITNANIASAPEAGLDPELEPPLVASGTEELVGETGVMIAVAIELTTPEVDIGVTVLTDVAVVLDVPELPNRPTPFAPKRLNSATVAPNSSPVVMHPLISNNANCPDHIGDANANVDTFPTYSCTTSLVAASYGFEMVMFEKVTICTFSTPLSLAFEAFVAEVPFQTKMRAFWAGLLPQSSDAPVRG